MSRQYRIPVKRASVFTCERQFIADAFCQLEILSAKNRVGRERLTEFFRDVQVAGPYHSVIQFIDQKKVREAEHRVRVEDFDNRSEPAAALDVPFHDSQERTQSWCSVGDSEDSGLVEQAI